MATRAIDTNLLPASHARATGTVHALSIDMSLAKTISLVAAGALLALAGSAMASMLH